MKKMLVLFLLLLSGSLFAGSGRAVVPHWAASTTDTTQIYITNITGNTLTATVTFYSNDGGAVTSTITKTNITSDSIDPNETGMIKITGTFDWGYAVVEWSNQGTDENLYGLVVHALRYFVSGDKTMESSIPVNGGMPF